MNYKKHNILVVDDNPHILTALPALLRPYFNMVKTLDGPEGLMPVLQQNHFDLIMLDMNFSAGAIDGQEGFSCMQNILQHDPFILVVLLAGSASVDMAVKGIRAGAADFVMKPWNPEKLVLNIKLLLRLRHLENELKSLKPFAGRKGKQETFNLQDAEKHCIQKAIYAYDGNMSHAAKQLGITRATLYAKVRKYFGEDDGIRQFLQATKS